MSYLLVGVAGLELTAEERDWLRRPQVGGLTLFRRNIATLNQLEQLVGEIRALDENALICVDQEGGKVQRLASLVTRLPALGKIGSQYEADQDEGLELAFTHAWLMASEVRALGIDQSFAPVLDMNCGSEVIGDRAFGSDPLVLKELSRAYLKGMHQAGMAAVGKHYPGHGSVVPDTHLAAAIDQRSFDEIVLTDLRPFTVAIQQGLDAIMMAHVCYPKICPEPAGYSAIWIDQLLRQRSGFGGIVFSDDLGMRGAASAGTMSQRLLASLAAGCDFALVCDPEDTRSLIDEVDQWPELATSDPRLQLRLHGEIPIFDWPRFAVSEQRRTAQQQLQQLDEELSCDG